jgi:hypothetical protein
MCYVCIQLWNVFCAALSRNLILPIILKTSRDLGLNSILKFLLHMNNSLFLVNVENNLENLFCFV